MLPILLCTSQPKVVSRQDLMLHYCFRSSSKYRVVFRFSHSSMLTKGEKCYKMYKTKSLQYEPFAEAMSVQFTGRAECHTLCTLSIDELILLHDRNMILRQLGTCYGKDFILINSDWKKTNKLCINIAHSNISVQICPVMNNAALFAFTNVAAIHFINKKHQKNESRYLFLLTEGILPVCVNALESFAWYLFQDSPILSRCEIGRPNIWNILSTHTHSDSPDIGLPYVKPFLYDRYYFPQVFQCG